MRSKGGQVTNSGLEFQLLDTEAESNPELKCREWRALVERNLLKGTTSAPGIEPQTLPTASAITTKKCLLNEKNISKTETVSPDYFPASLTSPLDWLLLTPFLTFRHVSARATEARRASPRHTAARWHLLKQPRVPEGPLPICRYSPCSYTLDFSI